MNIPQSALPRVVVIGGGFAGINFLKSLSDSDFQTVLLDKHNYHTFQPLLYQVATSGLEPDSIAYPLRKLLKKKKNFHFRLAEVLSIDADKKSVMTSIGAVHFDILVIATGATSNFFGNEGIASNTLGMKTVPESLNIRSLLLQNLETALNTDSTAEREALMNVTIVGAGPTGVELAGAMSELRNHVLPKDYPGLDFSLMQVNLVEASSAVLASMSSEAQQGAEKFLRKMDVGVYLNTFVNDYDGQKVKLSNGDEIASQLVIWAAGVKGNPVTGLADATLSRGDRIRVNEVNLVAGSDSIYSIGDVAVVESEADGNGHPMLAQVAIQQGNHLAKNLALKFLGRDMIPFCYNDPGTMATIGRNKAVVDLKRWKFQGAFAWLVWMLIHVVSLIGFRNKLLVLINWTVSYFRYGKDIRLIIRPYKK